MCSSTSFDRILVLNGYPNSITEEKVKLVKRMKCLSVGIGLGTGNAGLRDKLLGRHTKNDQFFQAVEIIKNHGIRVASFKILGLLGETREMVHQTIALNKKAQPDIADMSNMFPFSGTEMYRICKNIGILTDDFENISYFRNETVLDMPDLTIGLI